MEQISINWEPQRRMFTVGELTRAIRGLLGAEFGDIWVAGEVSGVKHAASGHYYFTLKDEEAQLRCACFRAVARFLRFKPQDGVAVLARGRVDVYEVRGEYQLLVEALEPQGYGALQFAFEQLKKKLTAEGLFDVSRKRPLPRLPRRIGIVTSPTGAVIQDMTQILTRRFPGVHIRLYPALVQGEGSVEAVVEGIGYFSRHAWADIVIVGRGGGSLEDLWTFNEEAVARAIAACPIPVVSAVGHETDFTIADFVADLRAPTPSAAAEIALPTQQQLLEQITVVGHKLEQWTRYRLAHAAATLHRQGIDRATGSFRRTIGRTLQRVDELDYRLRHEIRSRLEWERRRHQTLEFRLRERDLRLRLGATRRRLEAATAAMSQVAGLRLAAVRGHLDPLAAQLAQLSPLRVLERGYAIVQDSTGHVIKDSTEAPVESVLRIRLSKGRLRAIVVESHRE
jgi:exodeoxyribonuclease VII large subunit